MNSHEDFHINGTFKNLTDRNNFKKNPHMWPWNRSYYLWGLEVINEHEFIVPRYFENMVLRGFWALLERPHSISVLHRFSLFLLCLHDTYGCFPTTLLEHWFSRCSSQSSKRQHPNKKIDLYRLHTKCKSEALQQKLNFVKANAVWYQTITAMFKCQTFLMKGLSFFEQWNMDFRSVVLYS